MHIGDVVVVRGRGFAKVVALGDVIVAEEIDLEPGEQSQFEIPSERAAEALRPLASRGDAERALAILATKPPRAPLDERALIYRRAYKRADLGELATLLAAAYAGKAETPETQYQAQLERAVFGELALVLGLSRKALKARLRAAAKGQPAPSEPPDRARELAATRVPEIAGYEEIGAFAVEQRIAAGEASAELSATAKPGIWIAYAVRDEEADDIAELVAVHASRVADLVALSRKTVPLGRAPIEGAHFAIFDAAAVDDEETVDKMWNRVFDIVDDRVAVVGLGGDGVAEVSAAFEGDRAILVRAAL